MEYLTGPQKYVISIILFMVGPSLIGLILGYLVATYGLGHHRLVGSIIGLVSGLLGTIIGVGTFFAVLSTLGINYPATLLLATVGPAIGMLSPLIWAPLFLRWRAPALPPSSRV